MKKVLYVSLLAASLVGTSSLYAATEKTTTFKVKLTITESCDFNSASDIDFGSLDRSTQTTKTANGTLAVTCTLGTPYKIALDSNRAMANTADATTTVAYDLYQDAALNTLWAQSTDTAGQFEGTGTGIQQSLTVYGKLKGNTNVKAGTYEDTVTAKVTY